MLNFSILLFTSIYALSVRTSVGWLMIFLVGNVNLCTSFLVVITGAWSTVSVTVDTMSTLLRELVSLRYGHVFLDDSCQLTRSQLQCIIDCVCCCAC